MFAYLIIGLAIYTLLTIEVSSISFLFSALVMMLYIVPYFTLWDEFKYLHLVSEKGGAEFFSFIFFSYVAFIAGTKLCVLLQSGRAKIQLPRVVFNSGRYERYSIIVGIIGVAGYGYFILRSGAGYFVGHNSGDFSVGGYVYELRYFVFSSFLLLFQAYLNGRLSKKGTLFLVAIFAFLAFDAYIQQQRGSWIRFGVIILLSYLFHTERFRKVRLTTLLVRYKRVFILGLFFAFLLSFTLQIRKFYTPQSSFIEQVGATFGHMVEKPSVMIGGSGVDEGNEFVTAYNAYRSNVVARTYDYGYKWLYPFINFVPRSLWKGKPTWFTFSNDVFTTMDKHVVFGHTPGSAETGIIDAFYRFLYFTPLFFLFFGFYTERLHRRAKENFHARLFYVCFFIGCFYFITQNMMPFVIFTLYMYIPVWVVVKTTSRKLGKA